jgi:hypothetical protein
MAKELPKYAKLLHYFHRGMWIAGSLGAGSLYFPQSCTYLMRKGSGFSMRSSPYYQSYRCAIQPTAQVMHPKEDVSATEAFAVHTLFGGIVSQAVK